MIDYTKKKEDEYKYNPPNMGAPIAPRDEFNKKYGNYDFSPSINYEENINKYASNGNFNAAAVEEGRRNTKIASGFGGKYQPTYRYNYNSKYGDKIDALRKNLENYDSFNYNPLKDDAYKSLSAVYGKNADKAAKNVLGQAASANGGRLSAGAVVASDLAYQDKMSQLEAEIPQLRQAAYNMYMNEKNDMRNLMNDYITAENENYSRWSDNYNRMYQNARDLIRDSQWQAEMDYKKETDLRDFNEDVRRDTRDYNEDVRRDTRDYNEDVRRDTRDYNEDVRRDTRDYNEDVRRYNNDYEADNGRKAPDSSVESIVQNTNDTVMDLDTQAAYDKAIKGATPAEREKNALDMLTNGEITVSQFQQILERIAG